MSRPPPATGPTPHPHRRRGPPALVPPPVLLAALGAAALAACGERASLPGEGDTRPTRLAAWTVSDEPTLQIGVLSGEAAYQFDRVTGVARLPDGGVAVTDAGSGQVRFFDARGRFVVAQGGKGEGPGEWRGPDRVRWLGGDRVLVLDNNLRRQGIVGTDGTYRGSTPMRDDVLFPSDHWIHGRFVVDAPLRPEERGVVARALEGAGAGSGSVELARVTPGGRIWTTRWVRSDAPLRWTVYDLQGTPVGRLSTPARFEVHDQGEDWILGVWRDSLDVEYVRLYGLDRGGEPYDARALTAAVEASDAPAPTFSRVGSGTYPDLSSAVKMLATRQEIHYSQHYTYTTSFDSLAADTRPPFRLPDGVRLEMLRAGADGWAGRLVRDGGGEGCMISYGRFRLLGVRSGSVLCWGEPPGSVRAGS